MIIRRLTEKDLSAFRAIWAEGLMRVPSAFLIGAEEARAMPNASVLKMLETSLVLGAYDDDKRIVGIISARQGGPQRMRHMADVGPLYVKAGAEGQGIGRALLEAMLEQLTENGIKQAELCVDVENPRARRLYEAQGFHVFGRRPRSVIVDGTPRDDFLMIKALDGTNLRRDA